MDCIDCIIKSINLYNSFLIMGHNSPDGDAIGSMMALENILKQLNKDVFVVFQNKVSQNYEKIIGQNRVNKIILPNKKYDVLFILDCSDINRIYSECLNKANKVIIIDHHINNVNIKNDFIYKELFSATGILIYNIINKLNIKLMNEYIATCLYLSIRNDTSNFTNSNTDILSFQITSELIKYKANINLINEIYENRNYSLLKLISNCFHRICIDYDFKLLYLIVKKDDIKKSNASYEEACTLIDYVKNVNNIDTYILFIEDSNNVKIRARSNTENVCELMNHFNGGGHINAAGAIIYGDNIYNISNKVINEFKKNYK